MQLDITVKKYIEELIKDDKLIRELMTNMSITTLPISKLFEITGVMTPQELYEYIYNSENHALLAEIGFRNNSNYQFPKFKPTKRGYNIPDEEQIMENRMGELMYKEEIPSRRFYKKKTRN